MISILEDWGCIIIVRHSTETHTGGTEAPTSGSRVFAGCRQESPRGTARAFEGTSARFYRESHQGDQEISRLCHVLFSGRHLLSASLVKSLANWRKRACRLSDNRCSRRRSSRIRQNTLFASCLRTRRWPLTALNAWRLRTLAIRIRRFCYNVDFKQQWKDLRHHSWRRTWAPLRNRDWCRVRLVCSQERPKNGLVGILGKVKGPGCGARARRILTVTLQRNCTPIQIQ